MDDGYSGANFNRPDWKRMIELVENDQVGVLIAKDMSRIGRNYLEVGFYTEVLFVEHNVRFIAVNSGVDSNNQQDNDFTPFLNIINEYYVKDSSKKVRAVMKQKGEAGEYLTTNPPYGYMKAPTILRSIGLLMMKPQQLSVRFSHGVWKATALRRLPTS